MKQLCQYTDKEEYQSDHYGYYRIIEHHRYFIYDKEAKTVTLIKNGIVPMGIINSINPPSNQSQVHRLFEFGYIEAINKWYSRFYYEDLNETTVHSQLIGLIDDTATIILPPKYEGIYKFNGNVAIVKGNNNLFGLIDCSGKEILSVVYYSLMFINNGTTIRAETDTFFLEYDLSGNVIKKDLKMDYKICVVKASTGLYGLARNDTFEFIVEPKYSSIIYIEDIFIAVYQRKYGLFDSRGELIHNCSFDDISFDYSEGYPKLCFRIGDRSGYFNRNNEPVYQGKFGKYELFQTKDGMGIRLFHSKRVLVSPKNNRKISYINHNLFLVYELPEGENKPCYGVVDDKGNAVTPLNGERIRYTKTGHIIIYHILQKGSRYRRNPSLYNRHGDLLIDGKYDTLGLSDWRHDVEEELLYNKYLIVQNHLDYHYYYGLIDLNGKELIPPEYSSIYVLPRINGFMLNESIIVDRHFSIICTLPSGYHVDHELLNKDGIAVFYKYNIDDRTSGLVTIDGKIIYLPGDYYYSYANYDRLRVYDKVKGYGYSDTEGNIVIPIRYDKAEAFINGKARVQYDTEFGYINTSGELLLGENESINIPSEYDWGWIYENVIVVTKDGKYGCIDYDDNIVIPIICTKESVINCIHFFNHKSVIKQTEIKPFIDDDSGLFGLITDQGELVIPAIFEEILGVQKRDKYHDVRNPINQNVKDELIPVKFNSLWGYVDRTGKTMIPFMFSKVDFFHERLAAVSVAYSYQKQLHFDHGFINEKGEVVISLNYKETIVSGFWKGRATIEVNPCTPGKDNYEILINKRGERVDD